MADLWRFPVKSLGGERVRRAFVGPFGILGDRRQAVIDVDGSALSARRAHALLGFGATCADSDRGDDVGVSTPEGWELAWDDPALAAEMSRALGRQVTLARSAMGVHDAAPVHLVSTSSLAAVGAWQEVEEADRRRFRANVVVELDEDRAYGEDAWLGATLALGDDGPRLRVISPTERCAVTTFDPDTLERDDRVLAGLARERENLFGVYARVVHAGWAEVGAPVRIVPGAPG